MNKKGLVFMGMGFDLVGIMISAVFIGQYLDHQYSLKGLGIVGFSVAGLAGWLVHIVYLTRAMDREPDE